MPTSTSWNPKRITLTARSSHPGGVMVLLGDDSVRYVSNNITLSNNEISFNNLSESSVNLNYVVGLVGAVLLIIMLVLLFKQRRRVPVEAILWTLGISFLMLTSWNIPPNPRLLITAFPLLMVVAYYVRGRWFKVLLWINGGLLAGLSALTFVGLTLRP